MKTLEQVVREFVELWEYRDFSTVTIEFVKSNCPKYEALKKYVDDIDVVNKDGWIPWNKDYQPIETKGKFINYKVRSRYDDSINTFTSKADRLGWGSTEGNGYILAYRIVEEEPKLQTRYIEDCPKCGESITTKVKEPKEEKPTLKEFALTRSDFGYPDMELLYTLSEYIEKHIAPRLTEMNRKFNESKK